MMLPRPNASPTAVMSNVVDDSFSAATITAEFEPCGEDQDRGGGRNPDNETPHPAGQVDPHQRTQGATLRCYPGGVKVVAYEVVDMDRTLGDAPDRLRDAAGRADTRPTEPGEWSAQQVVLHLVAVEVQVFQARVRDLAGLAEPHWTWVEPAPAEATPGETLGKSVDRFVAARTVTLEAVAGLDEATRNRTGLHDTLGPLDVEGLLALAASHDEEHIAGLVERGRRAAH